MVLSIRQGNSRISPEVRRTLNPYNQQKKMSCGENRSNREKNVKKKARINGKNPYITLLEYRNNKIDVESQAKLFTSRQLRSILPLTKIQLKPKAVPDQTQEGNNSESSENLFWCWKQKAVTLSPAQEVIFRRRIQWQPGYIKEQVHTRSYNVKDQNEDQF